MIVAVVGAGSVKGASGIGVSVSMGASCVDGGVKEVVAAVRSMNSCWSCRGIMVAVASDSKVGPPQLPATPLFLSLSPPGNDDVSYIDTARN